MAYEKEVFAFLEHLVITDKHSVASLMLHRFKEGTSSVNNVYKALTNLVGMGKLEKGNGFFRLPGCKSNYEEHAQLLTKALVEVLKTKLVRKIFREHSISEVGLRPDAIILLERDAQLACFVLEVCNNEPEDYLRQKVNTWLHWEGSTEYLSNLFNTKIPCFNIVVAGSAIEGTFELQDYLKEALHA